MKNEYEPRFIPCGDSMEKMAEIRDDDLENVSGGLQTRQMETGTETSVLENEYIKEETMLIIPVN